MSEQLEQNILDTVSYAAEMVKHRAIEAIQSFDRPSVIYRPTLRKDGNKWGVLYGDNIQEGVCGFGDTPAEAMNNFDVAWYAK